MNKKKAKLNYKHNSFDIIEDGTFVVCAISGKEIKIIPPIDEEVKTKLDNIMIEIDNKTFSQL